MKKKIIVAVSALALVLVLAIGGTVAWLMDTSDTVTNTFTYGDINITLTETATDLDSDDNATTNTYKMVPGNTITKDPKITVAADSEACWLFVKIEKSDNFDTFMTYEMAEGWAALDNNSGVYYRDVASNTSNQEFGVIKENKVTVKDTVTKADLNALDATEGNENYPTLTFTAYAVQKEGSTTAADAWTKIPSSDN